MSTIDRTIFPVPGKQTRRPGSYSPSIKDGSVTYYESTTDTAKRIRAHLAARFPATRFSVRSNSYSGGSSIDIKWTNGPSAALVDAVVDRYSGSSFDGMIDLKSARELYYTEEHDGRTVKVHFGPDYIFTRREISAAFARRLMAHVSSYYGVPAIEVVAKDGAFGGWELAPISADVRGAWWEATNADPHTMLHRFACNRDYPSFPTFEED